MLNSSNLINMIEQLKKGTPKKEYNWKEKQKENFCMNRDCIMCFGNYGCNQKSDARNCAGRIQ